MNNIGSLLNKFSFKRFKENKNKKAKDFDIGVEKVGQQTSSRDDSSDDKDNGPHGQTSRS